MNHLNILLMATTLLLSSQACRPRRALLRDTVVLKNGNSMTGTIYWRDSAHIRLVENTLSTQIIKKVDIDTVVGYKLRTGVLGISSGIFQTPYYSIFRGESYRPTSGGLELQWGAARFRRTYRYLSFTYLPAAPYRITKWSIGWQYYFWKNYTAPFTAYAGIRPGLLDVAFNNIPQFIIEPYGGAEWRLHPQWRAYGQWTLQQAPFARNRQTGMALQVGLRFYMRHFNRRYAKLNQRLRP